MVQYKYTKTMRWIYIIFAIILASSCTNNKKSVRNENQVPDIDVSDVLTDSVTLYKEYPGTLNADRQADVYCRVNGYISKAKYTGGDYVHEGQILFTIDAPDIKNDVSEAEAALSTAISQNEYAEQHYKAVAQAYESRAVSKMEVADAQNTRDQSRAAVISAQARLENARQQLGYCTITAPFSGHITTGRYSGGSYVNGSGSPVALATVYDDATVVAVFAIEDASFMRMFENPNNRHLIDYTAIPITFEEILPHTYTADLTYMAPNVDTSTGTLVIHAKIRNIWHELRAGMYCTIHMPYKVEPHAMLVRDASLGTDQLGKYLYIVNDSNKVVYTPVEIGNLVDDTMRVVTSGIEPGYKYVTTALLKVRNEMTINPKIQ